jgi:long-chain acyl-CoA synthetase
LVFEERKSEIIKNHGFAVFPTQVELVLEEIEEILDAAVLGIRDERKGEILAAALVTQTGDKSSIREIIEFCRRRLPFFSIPQRFEFFDSLPYEPSGKLSRRLLKEMFMERIRQR